MKKSLVKKLRTALLGITLAVTGCEAFFPPKEIVFDIPKIESSDYEELFRKVGKHVKYDSDQNIYGVEEYFADPGRTWKEERGDCEDTSGTDLYLAYRDYGIKGDFIMGGLPGIGYFHSWFEVNGVEYESKTGERHNFDSINMRRRFTYDQIMEMFREREESRHESSDNLDSFYDL